MHLNVLIYKIEREYMATIDERIDDLKNKKDRKGTTLWKLQR